MPQQLLDPCPGCGKTVAVGAAHKNRKGEPCEAKSLKPGVTR